VSGARYQGEEAKVLLASRPCEFFPESYVPPRCARGERNYTRKEMRSGRPFTTTGKSGLGENVNRIVNVTYDWMSKY